jgi:hypothetical protein
VADSSRISNPAQPDRNPTMIMIAKAFGLVGVTEIGNRAKPLVAGQLATMG